MAKSIAGVFDRRDDAHRAAQELLNHGIAPERISVITGRADEAANQAQDLKGDEAVGALAAGGGAALAGLTAFAIPAIGTVLAAGAAAAALSAALKADQETDQDDDAQLRLVLRTAGLMEEQAGVYAEELRRGRTLVAVSAEDDQSDPIADVLRREGGQHLDFRRRKA